MTALVRPGDLVMVVKANPCCGGAKSLGQVFTVADLKPLSVCRCDDCGRDSVGTFVARADRPGHGEYLPQVFKIDPPTEGDSLPTRKNLEVTA